MVALRAHMQERYEDWGEDLPIEQEGRVEQAVRAWRAFFADCAPPAFAAIPEALQIANGAHVWPGRKRYPLPGAPEEAHICRAFDGIGPEDVRVVFLGQDPYPAIECATGRSFEDGIPDVANRALRPAMRNLGKSARALAGGGEEKPFCPSRPGRAAAIRTHFDTLRDRGVLFINASWTFSMRDDAHKTAHRALWQPVTSHLLSKIARRPGPPVIFLLLGNDAKAVFDQLGLLNVRAVRHVHPTSWGGRFFQEENPFRRVNDVLQEFGEEPINWWPVPDGAQV